MKKQNVLAGIFAGAMLLAALAGCSGGNNETEETTPAGGETVTELTGVVSYVNTRVTGGILAFLISAIGYAGTALVIGAVGNRIDKKVRIYR